MASLSNLGGKTVKNVQIDPQTTKICECKYKEAVLLEIMIKWPVIATVIDIWAS